MAIAFTVFVMLTVLLAVFIILIFVSKRFRKFLFHKDYEQSEQAENDVPEAIERAEEQVISFDAEQTVDPQAEMTARSAIDPVPTVPLELTNEPEQRTVNIDRRVARRKTSTLDDIRTVEIPETKPYQARREADRARFITSTPRTGSRPRSDVMQSSHRVPPRRTTSTNDATNKDGDDE